MFLVLQFKTHCLNIAGPLSLEDTFQDPQWVPETE